MSMIEKKTSSVNDFYTVGIGTSAGGLEALQRLFDCVPDTKKFAFVIIQHLSPNFKSLMEELLQKHTNMPVHKTEDGVLVEPGNIYLIPSKKNMVLSNGKLLLMERAPLDSLNLPIDIFLKSLSEDQLDKAIGIILSGTGSDGSRGLISIKDYGGFVMVQDPETSIFDGMPQSAIATGQVDAVLPPEKIYLALVHHADESSIKDKIEIWKENIDNDQLLSQILQFLKEKSGTDFSDYKTPTIMRRMERRMDANGIASLDDYFHFLSHYEEEIPILIKEFLIGVTLFFRDKKAFQFLQEKIIPKVIEENPSDEIIKIWCIGCSTGEEAYSIAILFHEHIVANKLSVQFKIFATDIDGGAIQFAVKGIFRPNALKDVPEPFVTKYFVRSGNSFAIAPIIRQSVIFSQHDITSNPPLNRISLVSCRNMLIYMQQPLQRKVLSVIQFSLNLGGYLFLGPSEALVKEFIVGFDFESKDSNILKKISNPSTLDFKMMNMQTRSTNKVFEVGLTSSRPRKSTISNSFEHVLSVLLDESNAACLIVDEDFEILEAIGLYKNYIDLPEDKLSFNLLKILPDDMSLDVTNVVRTAFKTNESVTYPKLRSRIGEEVKIIKLKCKPFMLDSLERRSACALVFNEIKSEKITAEADKVLDVNASAAERINELEAELKLTRNYLHRSVEDVEIINEELQATNEELGASNEELQSTNEELQSVNEELQTVNFEYQLKNKELVTLNDDIENLIKSTEIGTLFLDMDLKIRRFTPAINAYFNLLPQDLGRPIQVFLLDIDVETHAKEVLATLQSHEEEVYHDKSEQWFLKKTSVFNSYEGKVEGVVITFVDITKLKKSQIAFKKAKDFQDSVYSLLPCIVYVHNMKTMCNEYTNKELTDLLGYSSDEVKEMGANFTAALTHPDDLPKAMKHFQELEKLEDGKSLSIECRVMHKISGYRWLLTEDTVFERDEKGQVIRIMGIATDITSQKETEASLRSTNQELEQFAFVAAHDLKSPITNIESFLSLLKEDTEVKSLGSRQALDLIDKSVVIAKKTIMNLSDIMKLTNEKLTSEACELEELYMDTIERLRGSIQAVNATIVADFSKVKKVNYHKVHLESILQNLIGNAIKYKHPDRAPMVKVSTRNSRGYYCLTVEDNGRGIDLKANGEKIFGMFKRADKDVEGSGLGLYMAKKTIERNGGRIKVESKVGKGSVFSVYIKK